MHEHTYIQVDFIKNKRLKQSLIFIFFLQPANFPYVAGGIFHTIPQVEFRIAVTGKTNGGEAFVYCRQDNFLRRILSVAKRGMCVKISKHFTDPVPSTS